MTALDVTANLVHRQVTATWPPHGLWRQVCDPLVTLSLTGGTNLNNFLSNDVGKYSFDKKHQIHTAKSSYA